MLKLATVFSGIGAIEHALQRMNIDHEIVFACDNGDVDIFKKKINMNFFEIAREVVYLKDKVGTLSIRVQDGFEYMTNLSDHLGRIVIKIEKLQEDINKDKLEKLINTLGVQTKVTVSNTVIYNYLDFSYEGSSYPIEHILMLNELKKHLIGSQKKDKKKCSINENDISLLSKFMSQSDTKNIQKSVREIIDELQMLHEKIETLQVLSELSKLDDPKDKKIYVDRLYENKLNSNFVRKSYKENYNIDLDHFHWNASFLDGTSYRGKVDLFVGGYENKLNSNFVRKSYKENYNIDLDHFHWNASFLDGTSYRGKVDLFVGGSPCQAFSLVGKQRGLDDTRGTLFYEFARLVKEIQPKVFIYENVRAVLSNDNGRTWETMKQIFSDLGYNWQFTTLNAKDFGIPQNRERLFVVGFRRDLELEKEFEFPTPIPLEKVMKDFLVDNVSGKYYLNEKGVRFVTDNKNLEKRWTQVDGKIQLCQKKNQQFNWHGDFVFVEENNDIEKTMQDLEKYFLSEKVKKYVLATGTKGFYSKPEIDLDVARPIIKTMHKMHRAGVDNYVTTEGRIRKLTPRECLRLMGFCDSFNIVVSDTQMYQQAGNSIVVDVLIEIVRKILCSYPNLIE